jgi:hypothetical protein
MPKLPCGYICKYLNYYIFDFDVFTEMSFPGNFIFYILFCGSIASSMGNGISHVDNIRWFPDRITSQYLNIVWQGK